MKKLVLNQRAEYLPPLLSVLGSEAMLPVCTSGQYDSGIEDVEPFDPWA